MSILLVCSIVKLGAVGYEFYFLRSEFPGLVQVTFLDWRPEVPEHFEFVGVVFMKEFLSQGQSALGIGAIVEGLLEEQRFIPGDAVHRQISNSAFLRGKRELLQQGEHARYHLLLVEVVEPDAPLNSSLHKPVCLDVS